MTWNLNELVSLPNAPTKTKSPYLPLSSCSHSPYLNPHRQNAAHCAALPPQFLPVWMWFNSPFSLEGFLHRSTTYHDCSHLFCSLPHCRIQSNLHVGRLSSCNSIPRCVASHSGLTAAALLAHHGWFQDCSNDLGSFRQNIILFLEQDVHNMCVKLIPKGYYYYRFEV